MAMAQIQPSLDDVLKENIRNAVIDAIKSQSCITSSYVWARKCGFSHLDVVGILKSLEAKHILQLNQEELVSVELTDLGNEVLSIGSPEFRLVLAVKEHWTPQGKFPNGVPLNECPNLLSIDELDSKMAISYALKFRYLAMNKESKTLVLSNQTSLSKDLIKEWCLIISNQQELEPSSLDQLKKRKLIKVKTIKHYGVIAADRFSDFGLVYETDLTEKMIASGSWKSANFKDYNFNSLGIKPNHGCLHPLLKLRQEFRQIFLEMGFEEMPTNRWVESSFWNFDALFQPQFHPSRDAHDTFFIERPSTAYSYPKEYAERVKNMHQIGGYESIGYRYDWQESESRKNVLRTHTTAVTARMLHHLAEDYKKTGVFTPKKYFSIDRVFRNETTDQTHLAEFHQCEGVIADYGLSLRDLIGVISSFFAKQGITNLKFKATSNPYTEPSMEFHAWNKQLGKLVEIGNSGMFRPEMLRPMGFPEGVRVHGWGLSLERPAMIKFGLKDIRLLVGPDIPYELIKQNPLCRI